VSLDADGHVVGHWDRSRLDQVVTNLLSNALRHGAGKPIELTLRAEATKAMLIVRDHGEGVAPEVLSTIFDRFTRGSRARTHGGLGLGLYLAEQIVCRLGGTISVASCGDGASFVVELPLEGPP